MSTEYINHLSTDILKKEPSSWKQFLEDIGPEVLQMYPVQLQSTADCFAFGPKIAITFQNGVNVDSSCYSKEKGGEPEEAAAYFAKESSGGYSNYINLSSEFGIRYRMRRNKRETLPILCRSAIRDVVKRKLIKALKLGAVVLGIQNCGIPEWYQDHVRFSYGKSKSAHTVCIIGYYNDETLGPCFVSKMSNKPTLLSTDAFMKKKLNIGGTSLSPRFFSYGLLPLKTWFCNSNPDGQSFKLQKIDSVLLYPFEDLKSRLQKRKEWLIDNPIEEEEEEKKEIEIRRSSRFRKPTVIIDANHMGSFALKF